MREKHTRPVPGGRGLWWTQRLWALAETLPTAQVRIGDIAEFDQDCWFAPRRVPTIREVATHARRIAEADLSYPIILCADGRLMDGGHRLAKAWMEGREEITVVRFLVTPEPDDIVADSAAV